MAHNDILYNAVISGFVKAQLQGRGPASSQSDAYTTVVANAVAVATTVDTGILNNTAISNTNGTAKIPSDSPTQETQLAYIQAMESATYAVFAGVQSAALGGDYVAQANVVIAIFTETVGSLLPLG